ncbi:hypothetical protein ACOMHN_060477 [Nucella lapillus]
MSEGSEGQTAGVRHVRGKRGELSRGQARRGAVEGEVHRATGSQSGGQATRRQPLPVFRSRSATLSIGGPARVCLHAVHVHMPR